LVSRKRRYPPVRRQRMADKAVGRKEEKVCKKIFAKGNQEDDV